jgi:hypothetical protein
MSIQAVFLLYTLIANPFQGAYRIILFVSELLFTCQLVIMVLFTKTPENNRINLSLALLGVFYGQIGVFGIYCFFHTLKILW